MKKYFVLVFALLSGLWSCNGPEVQDAGPLKEQSFDAFNDESAFTRTSLAENRSGVLWDADDEIAVFPKSGNTPLRFVNSSSDPTRATFTGLAPDADFYFSVYPYQEDATIQEEEYICATIPNVQAARAGSFADGANLAVACCEPGDDLYFKNVGGLLSFSFSTSHTVKSVRLEASGSPLSGQASILIDSEGCPSVETYGDAYNYVELTGTFASNTSYYVVALPGSFSGLSLAFTDANGAVATYSNPITLYLDRNANLVLGSFAIPESKWVSPPAEEYVKVNAEREDWSGTYLIVGAGSDSYAANGVVTSSWLGHKPVTVSSGKISRNETTREYEVTVAPVSGTQYYSLKFANGNYLGSSDSNSGIKTSTATPYSSNTEYLWALSYDNSSVKIAMAQNPSRILRLNLSSSPGGFRTYTSTTGIQATLFRYEGGAQQEQTGITSSSVVSRNTTSAQLTASFHSVTSVPTSGGFKYGTSESLGSTQYASGISGKSGTFHAELDGLTEGTNYYYRAFIIVDGVTYEGALKNFRTASSTPGSGGRGWFELPAQKDVDGNGIDDDNPDYYYSWTMREDAPNIRNFSACYSKSKLHPIWVAAPMHSSYKGSSGRNDSYRNDPAISCTQTAKFDGYTRGHMLGSSDRTVSKPTNKQVFYYSNIGAQLQSGFNTGGGAWNNLESLVDEQWCADTLYQVIGCIFETFTDRYGTTVGKKTGTGSAGTFQVPTAWYKVLLRTKSGNTGKPVNECTSDELKCVGFILTHRSNHQHKPSSKDMYSVSEIEALTGLTFFPNVPDAPKTTYEASDWGL